MPIPKETLRLAIQKTTANGREAPNAYRIISWLYSCDLIDGQITFFNKCSDEFEQVSAYLLEQHGITTVTTRHTGASYEFVPTGDQRGKEGEGETPSTSRPGRKPRAPLSAPVLKLYRLLAKEVLQ